MTLQPSSRSLASFSLLSFDIYGTLIDWEGGIVNAVSASPFFSSLPSSNTLSSRTGLLEAFHKQEAQIQSEHPKWIYSDVLAAAFKNLVKENDLKADGDLESEAKKFGESVGNWPAFPDTVEALKRLKKHYKLAPLSNVDNDSVAKSVRGSFQGFQFDAIYTAQDIGSYKPDPNNFKYLLRHVKDEFGVEKSKVLHVAQSLFHDHVQASDFGIENVWVDRKGIMGEVPQDLKEKAIFGWRVKSMKELADMVDEAWAKEGGK